MKFHLGMSFKPVKFIKWIGFIAFALFGFIGIYQKKALAYSILETYSQTEQIVIGDSTIDYNNPQNNIYSITKTIPSNYWLISPSLYFAGGSLSGQYLSVVADYNIGIGIPNGNINMSWLNDTRNTLKPTNLRCGIGSGFKSGYDSTYSPDVTNFAVKYRFIQVASNSYEYVINITFNYLQQINRVSYDSINISCWFVHEPSNGLFGQLILNGSNDIKFGYQGNVEFSVSEDAISSQINEVNNNLNIINNTLQQTADLLEKNNEDMKDALLDETLPQLDDKFSDIDISSNSAISDLVVMPITIIRAVYNNIGGECQPYVLPFGLTGGNETLTLPCIKPERYLGTTLWNGIDMMICLFLIYEMAMLFISSFESITGLEDTFMSLYEPKHSDTYKPKHGGD